jgi:hypothetical protein
MRAGVSLGIGCNSRDSSSEKNDCILETISFANLTGNLF